MRRGFTLIELMISIALGLVVVLTAFAVFQATARTMNRAQRISMQNQLLLAGLWKGLDELDSWEQCNDPADPRNPTRQPRLYKANPSADIRSDARPFNDIKDAAAVNPPWAPVGGNASALRYMPDDPRWWYRYRFIAPAIELTGTVNHPDTAGFLPRYEQYGCIGFAVDAYQLPAVGGTPDPTRAFLHEWSDRLATRLGFYAMFDYLPAGSPIGVATGSSRIPKNVSSVLTTCTIPIWEPYWLYGDDRRLNASGLPVQGSLRDGVSLRVSDPDQGLETSYYPMDAFLGWDPKGRGASGDTNESWNVVAVISRDFSIGASGSRIEAGLNRRVIRDAGMINLFGSDIPARRLLPVGAPSPWQQSAPSGPDGWPDLRVTARRMLMHGTPLEHIVVRIDDPLTGESLVATLAAVTTTLRGARMNRGLDDWP
jgi:prepilin-type N-terminal cleavage/methylation domain-containing protein